MRRNAKLIFSLLLSGFMLTGCGITGPQGEQGPQGVPGETGPQGEQGPQGDKGNTPVITISEDGYWVIDGVKTNTQAQGEQGPQGDKGNTPVITISEDGYWVIDGVKTNTQAQGEKGDQGDKGEKPVITISEDGYWVIDGVKTNTQAQGEKGNQGDKGDKPVITISEDGYWIIDGVKTNTQAQGETGDTGKSAYDLYCDEHPEYEGTLEEWLEEFHKKDETDYSQYDNFLFTEVTYGGVVGYAANYIGDASTIYYPETFKNLPVLLATIDDSVYAPHFDEDQELPILEVIHFPSTIKVASISESVESRYDISQVKLYVSGSFDRFNVPFDAYDVYFEAGSLLDYRATNLRKYFPFANIYVKNGDSFLKAENRDDKITQFINDYYENEGGIKDQIFDVLGGSNRVTKFGSFELIFPKKFTVNFDGYDIDLPFGFDSLTNINVFDGVSFENNILKADTSKYGNVLGCIFSVQIDLGIVGFLFDEIFFNLYNDATKIVVGDDVVLNPVMDGKAFGANEVLLSAGSNKVVVYHNDAMLTEKIPLKCITGIDAQIDQTAYETSINIKEEDSYNLLINLSTFELTINAEDFDANLDSILLEQFKEENGFLEEGGVALVSKKLYLPAFKQIDYKGIKYDVNLTNVIESSMCVKDADTDYPTIFYNPDRDMDNFGYNLVKINVNFTVGNEYIRGRFTYLVTVYRAAKDTNIGLEFYTDNDVTRSLDMMIDVSQLPNIFYRLNEVTIAEDKFAIAINGIEVAYDLAEGSLGQINNGYVEINPGTYNVTLDLTDNTLLIEQSNGDLTKLARYIVFSHLKEKEFNVYIDDDYEDIVVFTKPSYKNLSYNFDFLYNDALLHGDLKILENPEMEYSLSNVSDDGFVLNFNDGFADFERYQKLSMSLKIEGLFLNYDKVEFEFILRHSAQEFKIGNHTPSRIENNVYYFDNFTLSESHYEIILLPNGGDRPGSFRFLGGEGILPIISTYGMDVPEEIKGRTYNLVFDMNTMIVNVAEA